MCGISGILSSGNIDSKDILSMNAVIRYRGPDDEGYLLEDSGNLYCLGSNDTTENVWKSKFEFSPSGDINRFKTSHTKLAFGHRRLSIIDLSAAGHQPMSYDGGRYWIIFNGEIYNHSIIRTELEQKGYKFISRTDTEVILASYAEWGERCLEKFVGMWAFCIYDNFKKRIFLSRDRYGIKPVYYWFSDNKTFHFGSEIKQFTVLPGWKAKMNHMNAYDHLVYTLTDHTDETMFQKVFHVPAGSYISSSINDLISDPTGRINSVKWYKLPIKPFKGSFVDAASIFRDLFEQSIKEHLNADVPVGSALSGGLDSSSIVCEVNRILKNDNKEELQNTFSSCSVDQRFDEKKWMDIVVNHTKINANFIYPDIDLVEKQTSDIIWHMDEPYQSQSAFLAYNVFALAKSKGVKVLLNGQGADEYLGGYGQFTCTRYADMIRHLRFFKFYVDYRKAKDYGSLEKLAVTQNIMIQLLPIFFLNLLRNNHSNYSLVKNLFNFDKLKVNPAFRPYNRIPVLNNSVKEISEHGTFYSSLPKYLRWEDRNSMAHSVEARVPFLDHRLVEFAYNLPDDYLEKNGVRKRILREAMSNILPVEITNRKDKKGFVTPEEMWVKHENPELFRKKISNAIEITNGIIRPEVLKYFDDVVKGTVRFDYTYWRIIIFSEWMKKFNVSV